MKRDNFASSIRSALDQFRVSTKKLQDLSAELEVLEAEAGQILHSRDSTQSVRLVEIQSKLRFLPGDVDAAHSEVQLCGHELRRGIAEAVPTLERIFAEREAQLLQQALAALRPFCTSEREALAATDRLGRLRELNFAARSILERTYSLETIEGSAEEAIATLTSQSAK